MIHDCFGHLRCILTNVAGVANNALLRAEALGKPKGRGKAGRGEMWIVHSDVSTSKGYCWITLVAVGILSVLPRIRAWHMESSEGIRALEQRAEGPVMAEVWLPLPSQETSLISLFCSENRMSQMRKGNRKQGAIYALWGFQWSFCSGAGALQGSRSPWDHRRISSAPAIDCCLLSTPVSVGITPYQLTREII